MNVVEESRVARIEPFVGLFHEDVREADDGIERSPKLVAGCGKEDTLGVIRFFSLGEGLLGQSFVPLCLASGRLRFASRLLPLLQPDLRPLFLLSDLPRAVLHELLQPAGSLARKMKSHGV